MRRPVIFALAALSLAACRTGELPPGGVAALDGQWEGAASATLGLSSCPKITPFSMTLHNGDIDGIIRNPANTTVISARFYAFVDTDGTVTTSARTMAEDLAITGRFETDTRFIGEAKGRDCTSRLRLDKRRGS
jgi:hypothetical protein